MTVGGAFMLPGMAEPARRQELVDEPLELDPAAVQRAYQLHRARRRAHRSRERETKRAKLRFWLVLFALVAASLYLSIVIWHQIQRTFGL
jgi:type VI protein secretion system component VasF